MYLFDLLLQKILNFTPQRSNRGQLFITWPVLGVNYADFRVKDHSKVNPGVNSGSLELLFYLQIGLLENILIRGNCPSAHSSSILEPEPNLSFCGTDQTRRTTRVR